MRRQVGGVLRSDSLMNARIGIPTISGDKSCPTCLIKEERMRVEVKKIAVREEVRKMTTKFIECENCEGSGFAEEECPESGQMIEVKCPDCKGSGKVKEDVTENGGVHAHVEGRYDLIPAEALRTLAIVMEEGVRNGKEDGNWRMIPCHIHINHALSHLVAVMMGEADEDHLGHALTRLAFAVAVRKEKF